MKASDFLFNVRKGRGCWLWLRATTHGYGVLWINGRLDKAHRVSYRLFVGSIPKGMFVCHKCDNRACVKPSHLFLGTQLDNMRDAARKFRMRQADNHPRAKLTSDDVRQILTYVSGGVLHRDVASIFGVHRSLVSMISEGKWWKSVDRKKALGI